MDICVFTKNYGRGFTGAMTSTYELIDRWTEENNNVTVITMNVVGKTNSKIKILKKNNIFDMFRTVMKEKKTHKIWYSDDHLGFLLAILNVNYVHTYHASWPKSLFKNGFIFFIKGLILTFLYILTIKNANFVGTVSYFALNFVKKINKKAVVIRNGIYPTPSIIKKRITFSSPVKIIMVGNVDRQKYKYLNELLPDPQISIDIYGKIVDKKLAKEFKKRGAKLKGFCKKVPYKKYDLYLSLSSTENLSMAMVEAIASGTPVAGLDVGGDKEVIFRGNTGFLLQDRTRKGLRYFFDDYIASHKLEFDNTRVVREFNWENASHKYLSLFRKIIKSEK
ncbi:MAG TPA: glycosyltransferase family 4 protein [Candidatus Dwaynia gallinarum]|nr:glycosyltransferase family 4 protein [Candidatus Dwaynia gallinarum]